MDNTNNPRDYDALLAEYNRLAELFDRNQNSGKRIIERSHYDFNTLINSLTGFMYAAYENADQAQKPAIGSALKTSKLLLGRFNELTDYFSFIFGAYKCELAPSSLRLMLRQLNQEFDDALTTKKVDLKIELDEKIPEYTETDYNVVKKALSRLVENAIEHTSAGFVTIKVSLLAEQDGVLTLKFSVTDKGDNAPVDKINALLSGNDAESFSRDGFPGVGLQVARDFLSLVDSKITVENTGEGTTFSFILNAASVASGAPAPHMRKEHIPEKKALSGINVLLADDSVIMQQIVRQMLESEGAFVIVASNGEEAAEVFANETADVVVMDIEMPVLNGYDSARKIMQIKKESGSIAPIIGMTAHTGREEYDKCIESGMSRVVIKPFKYNDLMDAIFLELFQREYVAEHDNEPAEKSSVYCFEKIKGIDYVEGVKRLGGNEKIYFELLQNFRDGYSDVAANISNLLKEGHDNEVDNLLHMMKGISGNLSFNEVYDYSSKLKEAIELDNIMDITKYLKLFSDAIGEFVSSFEAAEVEILYNMSELIDMDLFLVKARITDLMGYLSGDVDLGNAIDACDDIYDYIKEDGERKDFGRIRDAVYSFDTELAAGILKQFMSKYM